MRFLVALQQAPSPVLVAAGAVLVARVRELGTLQRTSARAAASILAAEREAVAVYARAVGAELRRRGIKTTIKAQEDFAGELGRVPTRGLVAVAAWALRAQRSLAGQTNLGRVLALDAGDEIASRRRKGIGAGAALLALPLAAAAWAVTR